MQAPVSITVRLDDLHHTFEGIDRDQVKKYLTKIRQLYPNLRIFIRLERQPR